MSPLLRAVHVVSSLALLIGLSACKDKDKDGGVGLVVDASSSIAVVDAGGAVDLSQCAGCATASSATFTFEGIYRDDACNEPLAQAAVAACEAVPVLGEKSLTYVDEVGLRKAGEAASVTLTEQVAPEAPRFRKAGKACVRANEAALAVAPLGCAGSRVCRDAAGGLTCTACRTLANGCADFEQTRLYATITDPGIKGVKAAGGGGGNVARLAQCCAALGAEAKRLGSSPEAGMLQTAAAQCTALVNAAGPNGNAPELGAIRTLLAGRNVPPVCASF